MSKEKKSYLDLFLDTISTPKKRGTYFGKTHEQAIIKFITSNISEKEKYTLFEEIIEPAFRRIINGVLEMPKFHHLGTLNRDDLIDNTFYRMVEKMNKFQPGRIGQNGQPVKAFSYFSTVAKNHILEQKLRHEKILKHKADVESSIDLSILSEETLEKMSNYDKQDVIFESYEGLFNETSRKILSTIDNIIKQEESKDKPDIDLLKIGYCLKYLINKWDKIEFMKKNEFMRILSLYVGLKQQQVSLLFKKFKTAILESINPSLINKNNKTTIVINQEVEDDEDNIESDEDNFKENNYEVDFKYEVISMEDFEIETERIKNTKLKDQWISKTEE